MAEPLSARIVKLLLDEAWNACRASRYGPARAAAARAVEVAEQLDDPALLVEALVGEAEPLWMEDDNEAALARYTRVLVMAEDQASRGRLDGPHAVWAVAKAHMAWVACARFVGGIEVRELFGVLEAGDRFLRSTGHLEWRAGLLLQRARIHERLGQMDKAIAAAEEALTVYRPKAPGYSLASHRFVLGDILREAGRSVQAKPHYQAILDDPHGASPYGRVAALHGLACCAMDGGDARSARQHATAAVREANPLGDGALLDPLDALVEACRAEGDLDAAAVAATRRLELARRLRGHFVLYYAIRSAVDVALDGGKLDAARTLLAELDEHAAALDRDTGTTMLADEAAQRHRQLTELDDAP